MNGKTAKLLRRESYPGGMSHRFRKYQVFEKKIIHYVGKDGKPMVHGGGSPKVDKRYMIVADGRRRHFQALKKAYLSMNRPQRAFYKRAQVEAQKRKPYEAAVS